MSCEQWTVIGMHEIEAKFYVNELTQIEARLRNLGARLIQPRAHETNIRFDTPNHDLRREGRVLRLRQDDKARMTYKGASEKDEGVLSRVEIEFIVDDFESAKLLLESLGYERLLFYEKYRTTYKLDSTHVMLDELPIGNFIEIEGKGIPSIQAGAGQVGLNWNAAVAASYSALFDRVRKARKLDVRDLSFENFQGLRISQDDLGVQPADL